MDDVRINLFGTGCSIAAGHLNNEAFEKIEAYRELNNLTIQEVVSDYRNLHWLELNKIRKWQDFGNKSFTEGLYDSTYSCIEIKIPDKRKQKISLGDIYHQRSLFPIYNKEIKYTDLSKNENALPLLIIAETVIGKTGVAQLKTNSFDIDKMMFLFTSIIISERIKYNILTGIVYDGKQLSFNKPDVLVNGFYTIINKGKQYDS